MLDPVIQAEDDEMYREECRRGSSRSALEVQGVFLSFLGGVTFWVLVVSIVFAIKY